MAASKQTGAMQPPKSSVAYPDQLPAWAPYALLIVTALTYANTLTNGFTNFDDNFYILKNPAITSISWNNVKSIFTVFFQGNYHPFTLLGHMATYAVSGFNPVGYHTVNLGLHLANTWLVWQLAMRLSGRQLTGLITAALFAVHPMHVESVAWISELKDVLYTFFYLLAILAYLNFSKNRQWKYYVVCLLWFIMSLLSKPAAVTLPMLLLVIDVYQGRKWKAVLVQILPMLALAIVFGIINIYAQSDGGAIRSLVGVYTLVDRIFLFTYGLSAYLLMLLAPVHLSAMHYLKHSPGEALPALYYASPLLIVAIAVVLVKLKNLKREALFGFAFLLVSISVMLQIITVGSAVYAERYTYVASIGLFYIVGQWVAQLQNVKLKNRVTVLVTVYLLGCAALSAARSRVWQDGETLFSDVIEKEPESYFGYWMRGTLRNEQGRLDEAINDYTAAIERKPDFEDLYYDRGHAFQDADKLPDAIADFTSAIVARPGMAEAYNDRGWAYFKTGDSVKAMADIFKAIQLKPELAEAYNNCGAIHYAGGNFKAALPYFDKAIELKPGYGLPYFNRAAIRANSGNFTNALADFDKLIELEPDNANAWYTRGLVKYNLKNAAGACADWQQAATLGHQQAGQMAAQYCR